MIEPDRLTSLRVINYGLPDLARRKLTVALPLESNSCLAAIILHHLVIGGLKDCLPQQSEASAKVAR